MNISEKVQLISLLLKLVEDEENYKRFYESREQAIKEKRDKGEKITWGDPLYNFYSEYRIPKKTNTKDALRIIGRLGFQLANNKI